MKKILLSIMVAAGLIACNTTEKVAVVDRNADTQNPIMPIVYNGVFAQGNHIQQHQIFSEENGQCGENQ